MRSREGVDGEAEGLAAKPHWTRRPRHFCSLERHPGTVEPPAMPAADWLLERARQLFGAPPEARLEATNDVLVAQFVAGGEWSQTRTCCPSRSPSQARQFTLICRADVDCLLVVAGPCGARSPEDAAARPDADAAEPTPPTATSVAAAAASPLPGGDGEPLRPSSSLDDREEAIEAASDVEATDAAPPAPAPAHQQKLLLLLHAY